MKFWRVLAIVFFIFLVLAMIQNHMFKRQNYQLSDTNASLLIENFKLRSLLRLPLSPQDESIPAPLASRPNLWSAAPLIESKM